MSVTLSITPSQFTHNSFSILISRGMITNLLQEIFYSVLIDHVGCYCKGFFPNSKMASIVEQGTWMKLNLLIPSSSSSSSNMSTCWGTSDHLRDHGSDGEDLFSLFPCEIDPPCVCRHRISYTSPNVIIV